MNAAHRLVLVAVLMLLVQWPATALAQSGPGVITGVLVSGPTDPDHPDVVQITLSTGYTQAGCSAALNAIRNVPENKELIALAMLAYLSSKPVLITLDPGDVYFPGRCAIVRIDAR